MSPPPSSPREEFLASEMSSLELPSPALGLPEEWVPSEGWVPSEEEEEEDPEVARYMAHMRRMEKCRAHYSGIHGALLLFQSVLAMMVVIFLGCVAWWKAGQGDTRDEPIDVYVLSTPPLNLFQSSGEILTEMYLLGYKSYAYVQHLSRSFSRSPRFLFMRYIRSP